MEFIPLTIKESIKAHQEIYQAILEKIISYKRIAIFRHPRPDYDALGSQVGLGTWIKENFFDKEVLLLGDHHPVCSGTLYPQMDKPNSEWFNEPFLAIYLDVGSYDRVSDPRNRFAKDSIKIDHHPEGDIKATISLTEPSIIACCEILADFMISFPQYKISKETAKYLYSGIVGDSGKFAYKNTSMHTHEVAGYLLSTGIDISEINRLMFDVPIKEAQIQMFVLQNLKISPKGVAYFFMKDEELKKLQLEISRVKEYVYLLMNFIEVKIAAAFVESKDDGYIHVSLRSKENPINDIANKYHGGGHKLASGAKCYSLEEMNNLLADLELK